MLSDIRMCERWLPIRDIGDQLCKRGVPIDLQNTNKVKEERDGLCAGARDGDVADREAPHGATNTTVTGSMGILTASLTEHHPHVRQRVELTRLSLSAATYAPVFFFHGSSSPSLSSSSSPPSRAAERHTRPSSRVHDEWRSLDVVRSTAARQSRSVENDTL